MTDFLKTLVSQTWLPVTALGALAVAVRLTMHRATAARRAMVGYAALSAMAIALFTPWLPRFATVTPEATAPIVRIRDEVIYSAEKSVAPILSTQTTSAARLTLQDIAWGTYLAIAALLLTRLAIGIARVSWIRRSAESSPIASEFPVQYHSKVAVPVALDGLRRSIVLPVAAKEWPTESLASVLRHEEAHLRHRDGLWLLLSQTLSIVFWFNPIVWIVGRRFRRDIEFLADDEVVLSGVVASDYAQDMLKAAKSARRTGLAATTAFAEKASLKHRIASVLSPDHHRERVGMKKIGIAIVIASLAAVGIAGWQQGTAQKVANPTFWQADVKAGLTVPVSPENNFVGVLKDGRKVELVQVTQIQGGVLKAWKPDGSPMSSKDIIPVGKPSHSSDDMRFLLFRIEKGKNSVEMSGGLGSASGGNPDQPDRMTYSGNWMLKDDGGPYRYAVSLIEYNDPNRSTGYFTFTIEDSNWNLEGTFDPKSASRNSFGSVENLKIRTVVEPQDKIRGSWLEMNPGPWLEITWKSKDGREQDATRQAAKMWTPKGVIDVEPKGSYGGYKGSQYFARYYLSGPIQNLREIKFYSRGNMGLEVTGVKLRPNQVP